VADNVVLAGKTFATDQVTRGGATVDVEIAKLGFGDNGSYTGDVSRSVPLPVDAAIRSDVIQNSGSQLTPKFAPINLIATGTLVAAVSGKKIRVISLVMSIEMNDGDETYTFKSGAGGTALTGALGDQSAAGVTFVFAYPFSPIGHFETAAGALLELSLAGSTPNAQGSLVYVEV
jgi:hypothetical protein